MLSGPEHPDFCWLSIYHPITAHCSIYQYISDIPQNTELQRRCRRSFLLEMTPFCQRLWDCRRKSTHLMFTDQLHTISMLPGNARYVIASFYDGNKTGRVRTAHPLLQTPLFLRTSLFSWPVIDRGASVTLCPLELRLFYVWNSFKVVRDSHSITCDVYYIIHYIILYITGMFPLS